MRYYIYISDAKVDMLLPQVPGAVRAKVAMKLGVNIQLFSGSLQKEQSTLDNRVARLEAVEQYLRQTEGERIGGPSDLTPWIAGSEKARLCWLNLKWRGDVFR
jgi:hypothetical protein